MSLQKLTVNSIDLYETYGVYVDTSTMFDKPAKDVELIDIPGRNGDLIVDYGTFKNFTLTVPCFIHENFSTNFNDLMNYLGSIRNYVQLKFSNDPDHTRQGYPIMTQTPTVKHINRDGWFDLSFNCKPFRYLRNGDRSIAIDTPSMQITNPTKFASLPLLEVSGYGRFEILSGSVGGAQIEIAQHPSGYIRIDSENMTITGNLPYPYNASDYVTIITGEYPSLLPGENTLYADDTLAAYIYPYWREL